MIIEAIYLKIATGVLVIAAAVGLGLYIKDLRSTISSQRDTVVELRTEIRTMTTAKNNQIIVSGKTVTKVVKGQDTVKTIIKEIEKAPNPANCVTPQLSDAARNLL